MHLQSPPQPFHSPTTSLSSEGPKSLTRDSFFVDRVDQGVADDDYVEEEEVIEDDLPEISAAGKESFPAVSKSGNQPLPREEEVETMQRLGRERHMSPPVSGARMQGGYCSVLP